MEEFFQQAQQVLSGVVIHNGVLWIILLVLLIGVITLFVTGRNIRGALLATLPLALFVWFVFASMCPWEPDRVDYFEIKVVTWPDGTSAQMWTANGKHHNVTEKYGKTVDAQKWHIKRVYWKAIYRNIKFANPKIDQPEFFLVEKDHD